ncbi:ABC transporter ATP-binding protein [Clostridium sp. JS66]|uniref:ABC transporter ATP-binding protein n=1 Tax=Clostridium sp. JS66 TaxID=3064705 RepID=UPI00298DADD6|nr:ABC transporter ATP-binding protein [Clostridium sp. JS66]WPC43326.1 ABC transporter ATP-binding protein [Clostridium sp. JS66]
MENVNKSIKLKDICESFKYWPRIFKLLWSTNGRYLVIILILTVVSGCMPTASLIATQNVINSIQTGTNKPLAYIVIPFVMLIAVSLASDIISGIKGYYDSMFQNLLNYNLNTIIMEKANSLNLADFENSSVYDKLTRAQNEVSFRPYQIFSSIISMISGVVTLMSSLLILLLWKSWIVLLLIFIPLVSSIYTLKIGQMEFLIHWNRAPRERRAWYISFLSTRDTAFKELKLYNLGKYLLEKYKEINNSFIKEDRYILKKKTIILFLSEMISQISGDIIVFMIIWSAFSKQILIGRAVGLIRAVSLVQTNVESIINLMFNMYENNLFVKQLFEFMDVSVDNDESDKKFYENLESIESIEFKNVYFKYENSNEYALKNVSFKISKGEVVAIVGKNGSGKTTLVKVLTRLYDIEKGEILINNIPINKFSKKDFRKKLGTVFQDFIRYELTVRENIGFGNIRELHNNEKIINAAKNSGVYNIIKNLPEQLDAQLGMWFSDGHQLSGGQWQKIALARAFMTDAELFILDEPSSALDPISEKEMFQNFFNLIDNKIGIFITHRFVNAKFADKIIVIENGEIIEYGNHEELLKRKGYYEFLYNTQNGFLISNNVKINTVGIE